ncbi:MAG TPA: hypothetical protein EYO82_06080, partial [Gammaproteobacteria bacterium]|nr:hypothetical protein [Gammaproteobacteria bacterium]
MPSSSPPPEPTLSIAFSNVAHLFTHALTILYATAVLYLPQEFGLPYGEMLGLSSVGLILFGVGSLPAVFSFQLLFMNVNYGFMLKFYGFLVLVFL